MPRQIKFKGATMTLVGRALRLNAVAPDFRVVAQNLKEIALADFKDRVKLITTFPSLDTPVCDLQVKKFNQRSTNLSPEVVILGISRDLPFAQKRFCVANSIDRLMVLSDYKFSSFGINYGLLIKELNLLTRAVLILDKNNIVRYAQIVEELTTPPDYQAALKSLEEVINNPGAGLLPGTSGKCKPCEGAAAPLSKDEAVKLLAGSRLWQMVDDKKIVREFKFKDFVEAKYFLDLVAMVAEEQGHHPIITSAYNKLKITLTTHAAGGLTENDFIMAGIIDEL